MAKQASKGMERFEYGETQEVLRTSAKKFLGANFGTERVRELCSAGTGFDEKDWNEMSALGWHGLLIPENMGGVGLGIYELGILLEEQGYHQLAALGFRPDYFAVRRALDLGQVGPSDKDLRVLVAARLGKARLIDNLPAVRDTDVRAN